KKHISSPVLAAAHDALGVLTIETSGLSNYEKFHADALTILSAHAFRPLSNAWARETAMRKADFFEDEVVELLRETSDMELLRAFAKRLRRLDYARGLISLVDYEKQMIHGRLAWGADFQKVQKKTHRHFVEHAGDCQVLAVLTGKPELVTEPEMDKR